jgi:perosamine synthetase
MTLRDMIPIYEPSIGKEELKNVQEAVKSGWISSKGDFIEEFEEGFSKIIGPKYGISTSNGTTALHLALSALGISKGDSVIVPDFTFISPVNAILYNGANPVLIDSSPSYWNIDPNKIEEAIDKRTRAILVVHIYGHPADMGKIMKIANEYDLRVIEDCAESHGALYKDRMTGTFGDISCFSFYGNKIITTGEGGMCLTSSQELSDRLRVLRDHGMRPENKYWHEVIGYNYRMTNMQAAVGVAQLKKFHKILELKRKNGKLFAKLLSGIEGITVQPEMEWAKSVYWLNSILIDKKEGKPSRDEVSKKLSNSGIDNRKFFYPAHLMPPYKSYGVGNKLHTSKMLSEAGLNLPSSPNLSEEEICYITDIIIQAQK